jgi:HEAT repeat protein
MKLILIPILTVLICTAQSASATAQPIPMIYEATSFDSTGTQLVVVMPRPLPKAAFAGQQGNLRGTAIRLFESMKARFPAAYGSTTLSATEGAEPTAIISLDASKPESWDLVIAETYYTLKSLGFGQISAPKFSKGPVNPTLIKTPVLVTVQPWYRAFGSDAPETMIVALDQNSMTSSAAFRKGLESGDSSLINIVQKGLAAEDESIRLASIAAVSTFKTVPADIQLAGMLKDASAAIRKAVLKLIESGKIKAQNDEIIQIAENDRDPELKLSAARTLSARGVHNYDHLLEMENLKSRDPAVVIAALRRLTASGKTDIAPAVGMALESDNAEVRSVAVNALKGMKATDVMIRALKNSRIPVKERERLAVEITSSCPDNSDTLTFLVSEGSPEGAALAVRMAVANHPADKACGNPANKVAILTEALKKPGTRVDAMRGLGNLTDPAVLSILVPLIPDKKDGAEARAAATKVLSRLPQPALIRLIAEGDRLRSLLALEAVANAANASDLEAATVATLKNLMKNNDLEIRRGAVKALANARDARVSSLVIDGIDDADEGIRQAAVTAASKNSDEKSFTVLKKGLEDLSTPVRITAIEALIQKPVPGTKPRLKMLAGNARPEIRRPAVSAYLASLEPGDDAIRSTFLAGLLFDPDEQIRVTAVTSMDELTDSQSINAVGALVIDVSPIVRAATVKSLGKTRNQTALTYITKVIKDSDTGVRQAVAEAIFRFDTRTAEPLLKQMLADERDPQTREFLIKLTSR